MKQFLPSLAAAAALVALLNTSVTALAAPTNTAPNTVEAKNLVGVWTNESKTVLTILSVDGKNGAIAGSYKLAYTGAGGAVRLAGVVNNRGVAPMATNILKAVSFSARFNAHGIERSWMGLYSVVQGEDTLQGIWIVPRQDDDAVLTKQLVGVENFHRQGPLPGGH